jgi:pimeloyl-ACP methyl ester carboxylesterase
MRTFTFPVGYYKLHPTKIIDYQLNRWHALGYVPLETMRRLGNEIHGLADWKNVMLRASENAWQNGKEIEGLFLLRAAEFFTEPSDPDKIPLYDRFISAFHEQVFANDCITRHRIPYEGKHLPALRVAAYQQPAQGTLVMHGGFDSFIEEFYSLACFHAARGYDVILFEGPGQGGALRHEGMPLIHAWEKPARAVLDAFGVDDVTWLGISMGGWLCFRAAAFEPRIARVVASSIAFDYMQIPPKAIASFARWLFKHPAIMERMTEFKIKRMPQEKWGIDNLRFISKTQTALEAGLFITQFNEENQQPQRVLQDVLILTGAEDHFVPLKMHKLQVAALQNARSVTSRIFTEDEHAANHCQVGNMGLAMEVMSEWMASSAQHTGSK